ncbi:hypothetical protein [Alkaliphilus serpentinus]|uniref:hypothetical protein n=1 Tax=Alkaliphilus serpentinus TaxID=1482731 RepID=UPI0018657DB4|nr:hypothetical protein [Alkaliphilus serpentinus]
MASKNHRGKTLWKLPSRGRGTCPLCNRTRIKLLYEIVTEDGSMEKVCKECSKRKA